jgi:hypothetical protein
MATSSFVPFVPAPESVSISSRPAVSVGAWWSHRSGAVVEGSALVDGSGGEALAIRFSVGSDLWCWRSALSPSDWVLLCASVDSAVASGAVVFPVVALGASGRSARVSGDSAHGWFCGLSDVSVVRSVVPVGGLTSGL